MSLLSLDTYPLQYYFEDFASVAQFEYSCPSLDNDDEAFEVTLNPDVADLLSKRAQFDFMHLFNE